MGDRNVLGGELEPCGTDPVTGFYRDGCCRPGPDDQGSHTICAVVTTEFLEHERRISNDLSTPVPPYQFPGLVPGDRWCVTTANRLRAHHDGAAAPVVLASTHERALPDRLGGADSVRHPAVMTGGKPGDPANGRPAGKSRPPTCRPGDRPGCPDPEDHPRVARGCAGLLQ